VEKKPLLDQLQQKVNKLVEAFNSNGEWMLHDLWEFKRFELSGLVGIVESMKQEYAEQDSKMEYNAELEKAAEETGKEVA